MTDERNLLLRSWIMGQISILTERVMAEEEKRQEKYRRRMEKELGDLGIERREDIDDLYGYGTITERKREQLIRIFEGQEPDELYRAKIDLLQDLYQEQKEIHRKILARMMGGGDRDG